MSEGSGGKVAAAAGGGILAVFAGMGRFADDCGRAAVHGGDDLARLGTHGDDVARLGTHGDDVARLGTHGDNLAHAGVVASETGVHGERAVEQAVRATPRELGFQPVVARQAQRHASTAPGPRPERYVSGRRASFVATTDSAPTPASSFADDLTRGVLEAAIDPRTVADLVDGFLTVQDLAAAADGDEGYDVVETAGEMTEAVEAQLETLSRAERRAVERQLGPADVIAYRLAESRPLRRAAD